MGDDTFGTDFVSALQNSGGQFVCMSIGVAFQTERRVSVIVDGCILMVSIRQDFTNKWE